jgi:hypothetical protein
MGRLYYCTEKKIAVVPYFWRKKKSNLLPNLSFQACRWRVLTNVWMTDQWKMKVKIQHGYDFQSNMGRVFIFCFYFQRFKNITQTSSILLFWQTNNTIVFTLSTGRIVHGTICLERNCTLKLTRTVFSLVAMLNFYFHFPLIGHSNVCQNSSPARFKT